MLPIRAILHPTDFTPRSECAFRLACSLARDHGARLIALHVVELPVAAYGERITDLALEGFREQARAALHRFLASSPGVAGEAQVEEGDAAGRIVRAAREIPCDLIVMGTHGRSGLDRLLLGSVAEQVLRKAPCPVLTVKTPSPRTSPVPTPPAREPVQA